MQIKFEVQSPHPLTLQDEAEKFLRDLLAGPLDDRMLEVSLSPVGPAELGEVMTADDKVVGRMWCQEFLASWRSPVLNGVRGVRLVGMS